MIGFLIPSFTDANISTSFEVRNKIKEYFEYKTNVFFLLFTDLFEYNIFLNTTKKHATHFILVKTIINNQLSSQKSLSQGPLLNPLREYKYQSSKIEITLPE